MNQLVNAFGAVAAELERNAQGSVLPSVLTPNFNFSESDSDAVFNIAEKFSKGETMADQSKLLVNQSALALRALLSRNGVEGKDHINAGLPSYNWCNEVRTSFVSAYMQIEGFEEAQRASANKAWERAYERAGFAKMPKADNPKALDEAARKAKLKAEADRLVGKFMSDAKQDVRQAISNANAVGDDKAVALLTNVALAKKKEVESKIKADLKEYKAELKGLIEACLDKATLDKVAKLLK